MMFDENQMQIIKQVLSECDRCETQTLVGSVPIKYEFTKEFEEKVDALKRRTEYKMTVTFKRILVAATIVALTLVTTLVLAAWPENADHAVRYGNAVSGSWMASPSPLDATLDLSSIDYKKLPVPNGYVCGENVYNGDMLVSYQKQFEDGSRGPSISLYLSEVFADSYVIIEHDGAMEQMKIGETTVYYYHETWDNIDMVVERNLYLAKGERYVISIVVDSTPRYGREELPTHEEIATIIEALIDALE